MYLLQRAFVFFYSSECTSTFSAEVELRFCFVFTYSATTVNIKQSGNRSPCVAYNMEKRRGSNLKKIRENSLFDVSPASACVFLVRLNARVTSIVCGVLHKSSCEPKKEMTESHTLHINRSSRLRDSQTHAHVGVFRQEWQASIKNIKEIFNRDICVASFLFVFVSCTRTIFKTVLRAF